MIADALIVSDGSTHKLILSSAKITRGEDGKPVISNDIVVRTLDGAPSRDFAVKVARSTPGAPDLSKLPYAETGAVPAGNLAVIATFGAPATLPGVEPTRRAR